MRTMPSQEKISVIIPQYKTEWFIRLCLRSLRKHSTGDVQVIVIDNNSCDGSVEYLRTVPWIELIEHKKATVGIKGHREALDLGL
ncbi:MAG: glycosyltransferase family 2 protein, partial [Nitrospirota bacterium]